MPKKHFLIISIIYLAICLFYYFRMTAMTDSGFPLDDSWIHQVFARNIATGHGFSFEPGVPFAGSTAPLWTLLLAPMWFLFGPIAGGIALGILFQWLAILGIYKLTNQLTNNSEISFLTAVFSILCWPVIWGALSGMEIGLYSALSIWGLYFYFKSSAPDDKFNYTAYLFLALAFLSRPESAVFLAAVAIHDILIWIKSRNKKYSHWIVKAVIIIALTMPYFLFNNSSSGTILPRTFGFKVQNIGMISFILEGNVKGIIKALTILPLNYLKLFFYSILKLNPLLFTAIFAGFFKIIKGTNLTVSKQILLISLTILYIPVLGSVAPIASPDYQNFRYISNLLPLFTIAATIGLMSVINSLDKKIFIYSGAITIASIIILKIFFLIFGDSVIRSVVQNPSNLNEAYLETVNRFVMGIALEFGLLILFFTIFGFFYTSEIYKRIICSRIARIIIISLLILFGAGNTLYRSEIYATNVRNINERDVDAAFFLRSLAKTGDVVAASDIGAIGYFSNMEVLDLKGLISPAITLEMVKNDSLAFEFMSENKKVKYLVIAPGWFDYIPRQIGVFERIAVFTSENNMIVYGDSTIAYKANWEE